MSRASRIALGVSLVILGVSVAVFLSVTGVTSAFSADTTHEFELRDGELVVTAGDSDAETLLEDVSGIERIEITTVDGRLIVSTAPREPETLPPERRMRAKQIAARERPISDTVEATDDAVYTIRPVLEGTPSERAAVVGARAEPTKRRPVPAADAPFAVHENTTDGKVVLEREDRSISEQRALVVVDLIDSEVRYSVVVNLEAESVEAVVRIDPTGQ